MPKNTPGANYTYMYNLHTVCKSAHVNGALVEEQSSDIEQQQPFGDRKYSNTLPLFYISTTWRLALLVDNWVLEGTSAKFYGRLRLIRSILRESKLSV